MFPESQKEAMPSIVAYLNTGTVSYPDILGDTAAARVSAGSVLSNRTVNIFYIATNNHVVADADSPESAVCG